MRFKTFKEFNAIYENYENFNLSEEDYNRAVMRVKRSISKILMKSGFYGTFLSEIPVAISKEAKYFATDGTIFIFNPENIIKLTDEEIIWSLSQGIVHLALQHFGRNSNKDKAIWNQAIDIAAEPFIDGQGKSKLPDAWKLAEFNGKSAEEIYEKIKKGNLADKTFVSYCEVLSPGEINRDEIQETVSGNLDEDPKENQDTEEKDQNNSEEEESEEGGKEENEKGDKKDGDSSDQEGEPEEGEKSDQKGKESDKKEKGDKKDGDSSDQEGEQEESKKTNQKGKGSDKKEKGDKKDGAGEKDEPQEEEGSDQEDMGNTGDGEERENKKEKKKSKTPPKKKPSEQDIKDKLKSITMRASRVGTGSAQMNPSMRRMLDEIVNPQHNWKKLLERYISQATDEPTIYKVPARRFISSGLYLPGLKGKEEGVGDIVIAIDTSCLICQDPNCSHGMSGSVFGPFLAEMRSILKDFKGKNAYIVYCSDGIDGVDILKKPDQPLDRTKMKSTGGNRNGFQPPIDWVEKNILKKGEDLACLIYFTDGYAKMPAKKPNWANKIIWALISDVKMPFGKQLHVPMGNKNSVWNNYK